MKNKISIHAKVALTQLFIIGYLLFFMAIATQSKAGNTNVHLKQEIQKEIIHNASNDFSQSEYSEVESPIEPEQISVLISAFWILFGWVVRLIEKRRLKRQLKRNLKEVATTAKMAMTETEFENQINRI